MKGIAKVSGYFESRQPSEIRKAQLLFEARVKNESDVKAVNVAIGNVSLRTHPKMLDIYLNPRDEKLRDGIWRYSTTQGREIANKVFINVVRSFLEEGNEPQLFSVVDDGSSDLMKITMLGVCGEPGSEEKPLLVLDPAYTNYNAIGTEIGRKIVAVRRVLQEDGRFSDVDVGTVEEAIVKHKPGALLVIPYDNPSGQLMRQEVINKYAKLCVKHNIFLISDEAYRGLHYTGDKASTVWNVTDKEVPGIEEAKIRISLETMSKVFNACGLRMGALVTDNEYFCTQAIAARTTYLCPDVLAMHIVEGLDGQSNEELQEWVAEQREYYGKILKKQFDGFKELLPELGVSKPEASIYYVVDVKDIAKPGFNAEEFVKFCANEGAVDVNGEKVTLLVSPMAGFYNVSDEEDNPGLTQMRVACVAPEEEMGLVPRLFVELFRKYEEGR
jgi:aspartate aminotransferase